VAACPAPVLYVGRIMQKCEYCGSGFSSGREECPNCGAPMAVDMSSRSSFGMQRRFPPIDRTDQMQRYFSSNRQKVIVAAVVGFAVMLLFFVIMIHQRRSRMSIDHFFRNNFPSHPGFGR
jgi:uncharacterized membrane protein YvbJ